jgi:ribosomal protein L7/L12
MAGTLNWKDVEPHFRAIGMRLDAMEDQIAALSDKAGITYTRTTADVPQEVKDIARTGDTLGAIKKYRELTGVGMEEAKAAIAGL